MQNRRSRSPPRPASRYQATGIVPIFIPKPPGFRPPPSTGPNQSTYSYRPPVRPPPSSYASSKPIRKSRSYSRSPPRPTSSSSAAAAASSSSSAAAAAAKSPPKRRRSPSPAKPIPIAAAAAAAAVQKQKSRSRSNSDEKRLTEAERKVRRKAEKPAVIVPPKSKPGPKSREVIDLVSDDDDESDDDDVPVWTKVIDRKKADDRKKKPVAAVQSETDDESEDEEPRPKKKKKSRSKSESPPNLSDGPSESAADKAWNDQKTCLTRTAIQFRKYQTAVKDMMLRPDTDRFVAAHPLGSGKTFTAVLTAECLMQQAWQSDRQIKLSIVLAPATLLTNFRDTILKYGRSAAHVDKFWRFYSPEKAALHYKSFVKICTDNILVIDEVHELRTTITKLTPAALAKKQQKLAAEDAEKLAAAKSAGLAALLKEQKRYEIRQAKRQKKANEDRINWLPDWPLGVDKGRAAAVMLLAAQKAWKVLALSGTLVVNGAHDLQNLLILYGRGPNHNMRWIRPLKQPRGDNKEGKDLKEGKFDRQIEQDMRCRISYLQPEDVKADMPTYDETAVLIEMDPAYLKEYAEIEQSIETEMKASGETFSERGPFETYLRQVANKLGNLPSRKTDFILHLLKKYKRGPMIISTAFKLRGVNPIRTALESAGYSVVVISGDQSEKKRLAAQKQYNAGKADVIILTAAGSRGWNLIGTKVHVNLEPAWHDAGRRQAMFRGIRVGSHTHLPATERHVAVYSLLLIKPSQFTAQYKAIESAIKQKLFGAPDFIVGLPLVDGSSPKSPRRRSIAVAVSSSAAAAASERQEVEVEEDDTILPSIDFKLWQTQMAKAAVTERVYEKIIRPASIENAANRCGSKTGSRSPPRPVASSSMAAIAAAARPVRPINQPARPGVRNRLLGRLK